MTMQPFPAGVLAALIGILALSGVGKPAIAQANIEPQAIIPATTIPAAKLASDGAPADISGAVISAAFPDYFYIQTDTRACGIRVSRMAHGLTAGARANVTGTVKTNAAGERFIDASSASAAGSGWAGPLGIRGRDIGGAGWNYSSATGAGQQGVAGGSGLNNVGLLVQTAGRVTSSASDHFYVDDGSEASDFTSTAGVRVDASALTTPPPAGAFVTVTGVSSLFSYQAGGVLNRLILPRGAQDVQLTGSVISGQVTQMVTQELSVSVQSPHPTPDNYSNTWAVPGPSGTSSLRVHFVGIQLDAFDTLDVQDGSGTTAFEYDYFSHPLPYVDVWSVWVPGSLLKLTLTTSDSYYYNPPRYGFRVDSIQAQSVGPAVSGVTLTLSPGGATTTTGADGRYWFADLPAGTYGVTPSLTGSSFSPPAATVVTGTNQSIPGIDFSMN